MFQWFANLIPQMPKNKMLWSNASRIRRIIHRRKMLPTSTSSPASIAQRQSQLNSFAMKSDLANARFSAPRVIIALMKINQRGFCGFVAPFQSRIISPIFFIHLYYVYYVLRCIGSSRCPCRLWIGSNIVILVSYKKLRPFSGNW